MDHPTEDKVDGTKQKKPFVTVYIAFYNPFIEPVRKRGSLFHIKVKSVSSRDVLERRFSFLYEIDKRTCSSVT